MINIQFDPKGKEKAMQAAKQGWAYGKQGGLWLWHAVRKLKPSRALLLKSGAAAVLLGIAAGAGANYLPKLAGQSNITAVEAAQAAFSATNGGIITEAEFDIGKRGSRYEFEILSGGRKYDVDVDAMSGRAQIDPYD